MADDPLQPKRCAELLSALASPERLRIVRLLRDGGKNVTEISTTLAMQLVNVSHHLNVLRHAGLVQNEKQGRCVVYSLAPGILLPEDDIDRLDLGCCRLELPRPAPEPQE